MDKEEFAERLFEVCRELNDVVMKHIAINRSMGLGVGDLAWEEQKKKMHIIADNFYDEVKPGKVGKFG